MATDIHSEFKKGEINVAKVDATVNTRLAEKYKIIISLLI